MRKSAIKLYLVLFLAASVTEILHAQTLKDAINYTESEQFEKAGNIFASLIKSEPNNGENYFYYGENYFQSTLLDSGFETIDLDSAKYMYQLGMKKDPANPLNYVGMGKVLWYNGKTEEAKKQFYDAIQLISHKNKSASFSKDQKDIVYMKIAECYINAKTKDLPEAISLLNKAMEEDSKNPDIYILMGDALAEQNTSDASQAIIQYKKAYELDKKSSKALLRIGQLYNRARNLPEAIKSYDDAIKVNPNFAPAYRGKAEVFYRGKEYETAITNYKKYLELNSGSLSAKVRYASFLFLNKKYAESISEILAIQNTNKNIPFLYRLLAYSYYETGKYKEGIQAIETFFSKELDKKILSSDYEYYAKLLSKTGNDSLAIEKLKLAILKDSTKTELLGELGSCYLKSNKYPEAIEAFKKKISKTKIEDVNNYYDLGRAYYYSKQYGKADTAFSHIVTMYPDFPTGYLWRARANSGLDPDNKKGLAKPYYETLIAKIKPEDQGKYKGNLMEAYDYLGFYFMLQKNYNHAKCYYLKLKDLDPNNKKANKILIDKNLVKAKCDL